MADISHYLVVPAEQVVGGRGFDNVDESLGATTVLVQGDKIPRVVLRMVAHMEADPKPHVVTTRFDDANAAKEATPA